MSSNQCLHENTLFSLETKTLRDLYKNNEDLSTLSQGNLNKSTYPYYYSEGNFTPPTKENKEKF